MRIQEIIQGKKEWRAHMARVKALPQDYQIVYKEIQKYLFKVGPVELTEGTGLLSEIVDLFEEGAALRKGVLDVTGSDVAAYHILSSGVENAGRLARLSIVAAGSLQHEASGGFGVGGIAASGLLQH